MGLFSSSTKDKDGWKKSTDNWKPDSPCRHYDSAEWDSASTYGAYGYKNSIIIIDKIDAMNDTLNKMLIKINQLEERNTQLENELKNIRTR